jgi:hypothetical protein
MAGPVYSQSVVHYVVPYRDSGDDGEELRYSLRSVQTHLKVYDDLRVLLVGDCPSWYRGAYIKTTPWGEKQRDIIANVLAAVRQLKGGEFVYASDDYFLMQHQDRVLNYHFVPLQSHIAQRKRAKDPYVRVLEDTQRYLIGVPEALSWELHRPMRVVANGWTELCLTALLTWATAHQASPSWRTVYAVLGGIHGTLKIRDSNYAAGYHGADWISSAGEVPDFVKEKFPMQSRWER